MTTLGLAMIVRDEAKSLPTCLGSVKGVFDEIVVVDTGSRDLTKQVASSFGAKIYDFPWIEDFSAARNFSFSKVESDFIFWLDADDEILPEDRKKLIALKPRLDEADSWLMSYDYAQDEFGRTIMKFPLHRAVRNRFGISWRCPIHEFLAFPKNARMLNADITVTHRRTAEAAARDAGRNLRILERAVKQDPNDLRMRFYYAKELYHAGRFPEAVVNFEEFIRRGGDFHENLVNAHLLLAEAHMGMKDDAKVIEACARGIAVDPRWAEFYVTAGEAYYVKGEWCQAARWFERATACPIPESLGFVRVDHYTWMPHDRLCKCYAELGDLRRAHQENEKALKFRPADARLLGNKRWLEDMLFDRLKERPFRLNLGAGPKSVSSYRKCDLYPGPGIDFVFDQCSLPFHDGTVHAIYSEHALEHAPGHAEARNAVKEWARALRHGGHLILKVPDLDLCCSEFAKAKDRPRQEGERWTEKEWYRYTIYGIQESQGSEPPEGQHHRTGFTKEELRRLLEENGFAVTRLVNYDGWGTPSIEAHAVQRKRPAKVRWLVRGAFEDEPSSRIRRLNVSGRLSALGLDSRVSLPYAQGSDDAGALFAELRHADVVVFTQFTEVDRDLAERLNRAGVATVFDLNEDLEGYSGLDEALDTVRSVVFCSSELKDKFGTNRRGVVIPDAYETVQGLPEHSYDPHGKNGRLRVLWSGMGGNAETAEFLRPICSELGMEYLVMSEWPTADIRWERGTWLKNLNDADIVVSPQRTGLQPCKSNTKATQAMALGIPVVVSPLRSYQEAIKDGETGLICNKPEEWKSALTRLRDGREFREKLGRAAKASLKDYSIDAVAERWSSLIEELCHDNCNPPKVDIVIPTFNNLPYLKACIESIRRNTDWPHNVIVVNSGTDGTAEWLARQPDVVAVNSKERLHFSAANNAGLAVAKEPYVCLLNDDTIVGMGWLDALMREAVKPGVGAVGPFSNCDRTWLHHEAIEVGGKDLHPGMKMEEVKNIIPQIYAWRHRKEVHSRGWIAFYCTLLPRAVIDRVGPLDEGFQSGDEDLDYCRRIGQTGLSIRQTYDSWVFHFGGRTRKLSEGMDPDRHKAEDAGNHEYYRRKWGDFGPLPDPDVKRETLMPSTPDSSDDRRKLFVLYTGRAWERWTPRSVDEGGIGGSETCAVFVAREFARKGWRSAVFGDCAGLEGEYDGVEYLDHSKFERFSARTSIDLFVSSRRADIFTLPIRAKRKAVWVHDVWLDPNPAADLHLDAIDRVLLLSPWHKKFFMAHHRGIPEEKIAVTRNGVDLARFSGKLRKIPGRLIYPSSPDRGLETLIDLLPRIQKEVPEAELHVFYGFSNWEKAARARNDRGQIELIDRLKRKMRVPGVVFRDRVGQAELAREFMKAELYAYPTWFTETFCISAAESFAAGTPVVTTDVAALATTVGDAGVLVPVTKNRHDCGLTDDRSFRDRFVAECVRMLTDRKRWTDYSCRGLEKAKAYSWDGIAEEWLALLEGAAVTV